MGQRFETDDWSIVLPEGWQGQDDAECVSFFSEEGLGALQISGAVKDGEVSDADLREFAAEDLEAGARPRPVQLGGFRGFELELDTKEDRWRLWYLRSGPRALFVTYNCAPQDRGIEDPIVEEILATLQAADAHPS